MRLSTDMRRDEQRGLATISGALAAGITIFDTAHAYGHGATELGHNERLLAHALRESSAKAVARVVTKGGMSRAGGAWIPNGRAKAIRAGCEASLAALDGVAIDLYLVHAPDPQTPWRTTLRALARLLDEGMVRHVGLSNVNRARSWSRRSTSSMSPPSRSPSAFTTTAQSAVAWSSTAQNDPSR